MQGSIPCVKLIELKKILSEIISFLLVLLFIYAAFSKLLNYNEFKDQLSRSPLIHSLAVPVSITLPLAEFIAAVLLCIEQTRKIGLALSFVMMLFFTFYILYMLLFEKHLPCSCGGVLRQMTWKQHLVFNIFFTAISFIGIKILPGVCTAPGNRHLNF